MATVNEKMTAIADNIREKTGGTEELSLDEMASGVDEVYEAGCNDHNRAFWEQYQNGGKRTDYSRAFTCGINGDMVVFNKETFTPIYDMYVTNADRMFKGGLKGIDDLVEHLENLGVILDFSKNTTFNQTFSLMFGNSPKRIGVIDTTGMLPENTLNVTFNKSNIVTIDKIICLSTTIFGTAFSTSDKLENITFEGEIGLDINFSVSPLTVESLKSIITHLKDYSGTTSEYTYTLTFKTSAFEALEAEGNTSPNGNTWTEYIDDLKWNLTLA